MRQLQLFTSAELAGMRDRTASRNYSPERDEFRREHERHRTWGLVQRHGERLRRLRNGSCVSRAASTHVDSPPVDSTPHPPSASVSTPFEQEQRPALSGNNPANRESSGCGGTPADAAAPARKGQPARGKQGSGHDQAEPSQRLARAPEKPPLLESGRQAHSQTWSAVNAASTATHSLAAPQAPIDLISDIALRLAIHDQGISLGRPERCQPTPIRSARKHSDGTKHAMKDGYFIASGPRPSQAWVRAP